MKHSNNHCIKRNIPAWIQVFVTAWYAFVTFSITMLLILCLDMLFAFYKCYSFEQQFISFLINAVIEFVLFMEMLPLNTLFLGVLHYCKVVEYCIYSKTFVAILTTIMFILVDIYYSNFFRYNRFCFFTAVLIIVILVFLFLKYMFKNKYKLLKKKFTSNYIIEDNNGKKLLEYTTVFSVILIWTLISALLSPN